MSATTITASCTDCENPFEFTTFFADERLHPKRCGTCAAAFREAAAEADMKARIAAACAAERKRWLEICPPRFRDTDIDRLPDRLATAVAEWNASLGVNLELVGGSGACKTRAAFLCLREAHLSGLSCEAITHDTLALVARDSAFGDSCEKARRRLEALRNCDVLLLDDVGKPPSTERADAELAALIDFRHAHIKPIIWTSNAGGAWLIARFGEDRGNPIVRRLAEGAMIVKL